MKIKCILKRDGGTHVEIDGINYHFTPNDKGDHVADVKDDLAIERLLSIKEAYEAYEPVKPEGEESTETTERLAKRSKPVKPVKPEGEEA